MEIQPGGGGHGERGDGRGGDAGERGAARRPSRPSDRPPRPNFAGGSGGSSWEAAEAEAELALGEPSNSERGSDAGSSARAPPRPRPAARDEGGVIGRFSRRRTGRCLFEALRRVRACACMCVRGGGRGDARDDERDERDERGERDGLDGAGGDDFHESASLLRAYGGGGDAGPPPRPEEHVAPFQGGHAGGPMEHLVFR